MQHWLHDNSATKFKVPSVWSCDVIGLSYELWPLKSGFWQSWKVYPQMKVRGVIKSVGWCIKAVMMCLRAAARSAVDDRWLRFIFALNGPIDSCDIDRWWGRVGGTNFDSVALAGPQRSGQRKMEEMEKSAVLHEREERECKRLWDVTLISDDLTFLNIQAIKTLTRGNIKWRPLLFISERKLHSYALFHWWS